MGVQVIHSIRSLLLLIVVALGAAFGNYPCARAAKAEHLPVGSSAIPPSIQNRAIPFALFGNRIYLGVKVNGAGPFRFILDTGASVSVINQARSAELGLKVKDTGKVMNAGVGENKTRIYQGKDVSVSISDGTSLSLRDTIAMPMDDVETRLGGPIYGALGFELFDRYVGAGVEPGYRSLAWRLTFRHSERTLRDRELDARRSDILRALAELNVRQRAT